MLKIKELDQIDILRDEINTSLEANNKRLIFFIDNIDVVGDYINVKGSDYNHIKNVLRMNIGDTFLVSCEGESNLCRILDFEDNAVIAEVIEQNVNNTELPIKLYLFQGLPKGDKMDLIVQKAVECGASRIVPVEMKNCIVKLGDSADKKVARWQN